MSVLWPGNMREPRDQTAVSRLVLLLLLLLSGPASTVLSQEEDAGAEAEIPEEDTVVAEEAETEEAVPGEEGVNEAGTEPGEEGELEAEPTDPSEPGLETTPIPTGTAVPDSEDGANSEEPGSGLPLDLGVEMSEGSGSGEIPPTEDEGLDLLFIVVPVVLVILIATVVAGVLIHRRNSRKRHSEMRKEDPFLEGSSTEKVPMPMFEEDVPSVLELEMDELDDWMKKDGEMTDLKQQA